MWVRIESMGKGNDHQMYKEKMPEVKNITQSLHTLLYFTRVSVKFHYDCDDGCLFGKPTTVGDT